MKYKVLLFALAISLFSACQKDDDKPTNSQNSTDFPKLTGTLMVKIEIDSKLWDDVGGTKNLFLTKINNGSGSGGIVLFGMEVQNNTTYNLGEWNPGEYQIDVSAGSFGYFTSALTNKFQIKSNLIHEFVVKK